MSLKKKKIFAKLKLLIMANLIRLVSITNPFNDVLYSFQVSVKKESTTLEKKDQIDYKMYGRDALTSYA